MKSAQLSLSCNLRDYPNSSSFVIILLNYSYVSTLIIELLTHEHGRVSWIGAQSVVKTEVRDEPFQFQPTLVLCALLYLHHYKLIIIIIFMHVINAVEQHGIKSTSITTHAHSFTHFSPFQDP